MDCKAARFKKAGLNVVQDSVILSELYAGLIPIISAFKKFLSAKCTAYKSSNRVNYIDL